MEITGKCFCEEIQYRALIDETKVILCHCTDCQTFGDSAFRIQGIAREQDVAFTKGAPRSFTKITARGTKRDMVFCPTCGTHLCAMPHPDSDNPWVSIRVATSDQFAQLKPSAEAWCVSRLDWLPQIEGLVQFERQPVAPS